MFSKLVLLAAIIAVASASDLCHNATGACLKHGYECADGTVIPYSQRCDGIEQCSDYTDELMCEDPIRTPFHLRPAHEREAHALINCGGKCNCPVGSIVVSSGPWYTFGLNAPRTNTVLAGCNVANTQSITLAIYKKTKICRGYVCCAKCSACNCKTSHSGDHCQN